MGARSGGGAGGGMGARAAAAEFKARTSQARTPFEKGSAAYKEAQAMSNIVFNSASESGYGMLGGSSWEMASDRVSFATDFVSKNGNAFEKSVAQSIAKTIRPKGKGKQVAFVSQKQAWVMGKALSEMHVKANDFPW